MSIDDMRALKIMEDTVALSDGKYVVGALWNKPREEVVEEMSNLPSIGTAYRRLIRLGQKLGGDPDEWQMVKKHVRGLVDKGYAEKVDDYHQTKRFLPTNHAFTSLCYQLKTKESRRNAVSRMIVPLNRRKPASMISSSKDLTWPTVWRWYC